MTLRSVTGAAALVLVEAGYGSFEHLAAVTGETVSRRYSLVRKKHPEWGSPAAGAALCEQWVRAARQYLGVQAGEAAT